MSLRFHSDDLRKWAAFSGDYNPIHFEREAAARLGLQDVVVHGMLAMLPLKAKAGSLPTDLYPHGARWSAALLSPVPLDGASRSTFKTSPGGKAAFGLSSETSGVKFIKGSFLPVEFDDFVSKESSEAIGVAAQDVADKAREVRDQYPQVSKLWVFLDALVFFLYVRRNSANVFAVELRDFLARAANGRALVQNDLLVVHATHAVTIAPDLLRRPLAEPLPDISYSVRGKDAILNAGALFGIVEFSVCLDGAPGLIVEMGLMAKS